MADAFIGFFCVFYLLFLKSRIYVILVIASILHIPLLRGKTMHKVYYATLAQHAERPTHAPAPVPMSKRKKKVVRVLARRSLALGEVWGL